MIEQFRPCSIDVFAGRACVWALRRESKTLLAKCKRLTVPSWTARLANLEDAERVKNAHTVCSHENNYSSMDMQ